MKMTAERLRELFTYDPETGIFVRRISRRRARAGDVAGCMSHGYVVISIDCRMHLAHRLAWLYVHGVWPSGEIDHINRVRSDNRICNLRDTTRPENAQNKPVQRNNKSGYRGVSKYKQTNFWQARIKTNGRQIYLGHFATPEAASAAYAAAAAVMHTHNNFVKEATQ
jgi:hypothetical protein